MANLLNIGEMGALALHTMAMLATVKRVSPNRRFSVPELSQRLSASSHTLHKVVTRLVAAGLVDSLRGPGGGIKLVEDPNNVTLHQIIEAVDRNLDGVACLFSKRVCTEEAGCPFSYLTGDLEHLLHKYFTETTLTTLLDRFDSATLHKGGDETSHPIYLA